ncbi:BZ3500_MvSof-1268-A1-R1_Chr8-2g10146 [Microbotryum saponariae]|uniref:BZ3500_MvSof-1268-A1-R1_Chr8-2g10146 protein n=1 Tax=Microbotryum saponariae TaxID=289078 RepID=A0A2X0L5I3_9BASI|nr:BZ3500_MvSof-1268-A1-R1_Chr8-2g10146 [Microbotryum saponariae]SDA01874.1 BZ3501_MvSof-1269-A2-R1_Chr8-2g09897 [Microbotryum saponariae]
MTVGARGSGTTSRRVCRSPRAPRSRRSHLIPSQAIAGAVGILCLAIGCCTTLVNAAVLPKRAEPVMSTYLVNKVKGQAAQASTDTWVSGTFTEALLELYYPQLTVFNPSISSQLAATSFSSSSTPSASNDITASWASQRPSSTNQFAYVSGGAAGDPASLGWAWIVASKTVASSATKANYESIVQQEIGYLETVPRTSDGAVSHRPSSEPVQLWSDFIYMVPPFLAGRGLETNNATLLLQAYAQIKIYRRYLQDRRTGLWKHVDLGNWQDSGLWATGNGWAAAGMTRVLASMMHSPAPSAYTSEISDLVTWISEIINATFARLDSNGMIPNYFGDSNTFSDSASSALLASVPFRLAQLGHGTSAQLASATALRDKLISKINTSSGWLQGCVNPLSWQQTSNTSPEAQSFILLLEAAYRAYLASQ